MTHLRHGIFDDAAISVISSTTIQEICRLASTPTDVRRFRPNIVLRSVRAIPFEEDQWLGGILTFGEAADASAVAVTVRDLRCSMINIDPDGGPSTPEMKACVRTNQNNAGIYATIIRTGPLSVGQPILLHAA